MYYVPGAIRIFHNPTKFSLCVMISIASLLALIFLTIIRKVREYIKLKNHVVKAPVIDAEEETSSEEEPSTEEKSEKPDEAEETSETPEVKTETPAPSEDAEKETQTPEDTTVSLEGTEEA